MWTVPLLGRGRLRVGTVPIWGVPSALGKPLGLDLPGAYIIGFLRRSRWLSGPHPQCAFNDGQAGIDGHSGLLAHKRKDGFVEHA
jgi:hypothetical protein